MEVAVIGWKQWSQSQHVQLFVDALTIGLSIGAGIGTCVGIVIIIVKTINFLYGS